MDPDDIDLLDENFEGDGDEEEGVTYKEVEIREQDRYLPIANIARIMKKVLPNNAKIAKESKESIQECVSEFISFITSEASDKCQQEKRKTINGDDLLWAMSTLGFDKYVEPLKIYLSKYRDSVKGERPEKKPTNRKDSGHPKHLGSVMAPFNPFEAPDIPPGIGFLADHSASMLAPGKNEHTLPPPPIMRQGMGSIPMMGLPSHHSMGLGQSNADMIMSQHYPLTMQHHHHHQQQHQHQLHQQQQQSRINNGNGLVPMSMGAPLAPPDVADSKDSGGGLPGLQFS